MSTDTWLLANVFDVLWRPWTSNRVLSAHTPAFYQQLKDSPEQQPVSSTTLREDVLPTAICQLRHGAPHQR